MSKKPHKYHKVHDFLKHHPMGVLSTVSPDGAPWAAAIYYVADEDFNFYFVTRAETSKYHNLEKTPLAALTVADAASQKTVQVAGSVTKVPVKDYTDIVFNKLAKLRPKDDLHWSPPLSKLHKGNYIPLLLTPSRLLYADYKHVRRDPKADYIEQIIP